MSLGDIMGQAGLEGWAEVALVLFFAVFAGIVVYLVVRGRKAWEHARRLPLDDGRPLGDREEEHR